MKKIFAIICAVISLLISGCSVNNKNQSDITTKTIDYKDIECESYDQFKTVYFSENDKMNVLSIFVPKKWNFEKNNSGYNIVEFSEIIGTVTMTFDENSEDFGECVYTEKHATVSVDIIHTVNKLTSESEVNYTHTFTYSYEESDGTDKRIIINMEYEKIDKNTSSKMMHYSIIEEMNNDRYMGIMRIKDNRKKVLILGNSFISSSSIGQTLQEMCGSSITVDAYSKGYAQVYTYTNIPDIMSRIKNAEYSAVFMCGFYSTDNVDAFKTIVDSCVASKTMLAIFPAHNENRNTIDKAASTYSYPVLIDWKEEINMLYKTGIDYYDFCIDDAHKHSTDLAGFVGAHMIYRAIFGKIPNPQYTYSQVLSSDIDKLGSYVYTGNISPISQDRINYFE